MLELWGMWSTPSLPSLPNPFLLWVLVPDRVQSMCRVEKNPHKELNKTQKLSINFLKFYLFSIYKIKNQMIFIKNFKVKKNKFVPFLFLSVKKLKKF